MSYRTAFVVVRSQPNDFAIIVDELLPSKQVDWTTVAAPERYHLGDPLTAAAIGVALEGWALTYLLTATSLVNGDTMAAIERAWAHAGPALTGGEQWKL